ncbi:hypothetical protein [Magnetospirillum sp. UT-4]|uniref:hypothetical protein n=1 Tax=Magnetospirillum sp. UT-4 TaxID=2681467 RepID=UPI00137F445B|nr:hypothetical protein [Magnetospirillum sp. UT-4]CAA7612946.1 putative Secreted protein [Magnetospirillum sp. UT-4]
MRHRFLRPILPAACAVLAWLAAAGPAASTAWNYIYSYPPVADFRTLAVDVTISPGLKQGDSVYIAPFRGTLGDSIFYFGLQTDLHQSATGRTVGKGIVFSRWGAVTADDARPVAGGWSEAQTHAESREGDFTGVRLPYAWTSGRYTFRMESRIASPLPGQWLDLSMHDHQSGRRVEIGSLRFPAPPPARLAGDPASFVEFYATLPRPPDRPGYVMLPTFDVTFTPPRVNGAITPIAGSVHSPRRVKSLGRVTTAPDGQVKMAIGGSAPAE